ncbi:MAG: DNA-3-methyladenine glycosylase family protein [Gaiellales bacterium]
MSLRARGPGGEPVDLRRTIRSHGLTTLPPMAVLDGGERLQATRPILGKPVTLDITAAGASIEVRWNTAGRAAAEEPAVRRAAVRLLRLDEDLRPFYQTISDDPDLAWAASGAGRLVRSTTVFEEVVKTLCTTNCSWSATSRMLETLVSALGEPALGAPASGPPGRTFPTPTAMAAADDSFYVREMRAGYRSRYLRALAEAVASGSLILEELDAPAEELPDADLEASLLALSGVGPYAAAHILLQLGRYSHLVLDSWTRPAYARLIGRRSVADSTITRRFRRFGAYAGLAFWVFVTQGWVAPRRQTRATASSEHDQLRAESAPG